MSIEKAYRDYEGSFMLGEADGDAWAGKAHLNDIQSMSLLQPDDVGLSDIFGKPSAEWLGEQANGYGTRDDHFDAAAYFDGFLMAVRRARRRHAFAVVNQRTHH
ncbi:MAG TPA: hypothetical protein VM425_00570 [Myxococcota bacterium]|nr:hypothetical protein [Myxococcota bacterium]